MNLRLMALGSFLLALPVGIDVPATRDSATRRDPETRLQMAGGAGYYALIDRGCNGEPIGHSPIHYREGGASIDHRFSSPLRIGLRGGLLRDQVAVSTLGSPELGASAVRNNAYLNPNLSFDARTISVGAGWIAARRDFIQSGPGVLHIPFSAHLRIGDPAARYLSVSWMENVPLYSGGGYFDLGLGFRPRRRLDAWAGFSSGGPFDGTGAALKADAWLTPSTSLNLRARLGSAGNQFQNGVSVGLGYRTGPGP